jgi:DNA-binding MarR family transcriptional regulator
MTPLQKQIIEYLAKKTEASVGEMAKALDTGISHIKKAINLLVQSGHLVYIYDANFPRYSLKNELEFKKAVEKIKAFKPETAVPTHDVGNPTQDFFDRGFAEGYRRGVEESDRQAYRVATERLLNRLRGLL